MCDLVIVSAVATPPTVAGGTGYATITFTTAAAFVLLTVAGPSPQNQQLYGTAGGVLYVHGLLPGPYAFTLSLPGDTACLVSGTFDVAPAAPPVPGCTDPSADNYDAGAGLEDGTCTYTPPALPPFFAVPLLQALRFVVRGGPASFDTQLFCEQPRPGQQLRPRYYQLVEFADVVRVQVLTSYTAVTATIYQHGGSQVGAAVLLQQVLTLEGPSTPLNVMLSLDTATGLTQLKAGAGGALPPSLLAAARLTLAGPAAGTWRITQVVPASVVNLDDYLVLNRPWAAPAAGQVTASWRLTGAGFNVWEATLPLNNTLAAGYYQVKLRATAAGWADAVADSEPLYLRATHPDTVAVDYRNTDNCFNMVFATGITPRVRVWATFFRQKNGGSEQSYTDSAGRLAVLASTATRLTTLETYGLPAYMHEKLFLACRLDTLVVNGVRQVAPAAYESSEVRAYALSGGHVDLQQAEWLGAGNGDDLGEPDPGSGLVLRGGGYLVLRGR